MEKLIETIVGAIQDKKGKDIVSLDLSGFDGAICSHFVVCNADSTMQVAAIADGVEEAVEEKLGEKVWRWTTWTSWYISSRPSCVPSTNWRSCGPMRRSNVMITRSKEIL